MADVEISANDCSSPTPLNLILIVVGESFTTELKELILQRVAKELLTWDPELSGCNLNEELQVVAAKAPVGEDGQNGEKIVQYVSDKLRADFLINPTLKTLITKLRGFLLANGSYRQLIYSGQALNHSGCWLLQDALFSIGNLVEILRGGDVCNAIKQGQVKGVLVLNVFPEGDWTESHLSKVVPQLQVRLNPQPRSDSDPAAFIQLSAYLSSFLKVISLKDLLQSSSVVGNIRFSRPTLYIFPSCQGDSALFGISGFNLLVNGGFSRKSCFWDFTRHLDRIDAMLVTHFGADNIFGIGSVVTKKVEENVHPEIGYVYMNAIERGKTTSGAASETEGGDGNRSNKNLMIDVCNEATSVVEDMKAIGACPQRPCVGVMQGSNLMPTNLYHKVGHGTLDMYVLSPMQDSKILKEFLSQWNKHGNGFMAKGNGVPLCNAASICALLVWKPSSMGEPITRILFTGSTTQTVVFDGLDRLKSVNLFQHPLCSEKELNAAKGGGANRKASIKTTSQAKPAASAKAPPTATAATDVKKAPGKKALPKGGLPMKKDEKMTDGDKKSSSASSETKSPTDAKQPMMSPSNSVPSEGLPSTGMVTPDEPGGNKKDGIGEEEEDLRKEKEEDGRIATDDNILVDLQSTPDPRPSISDLVDLTSTVSTKSESEEVRMEKADVEEKDIDTKELNLKTDSQKMEPTAMFDGIPPEGLPSPTPNVDKFLPENTMDSFTRDLKQTSNEPLTTECIEANEGDAVTDKDELFESEKIASEEKMEKQKDDETDFFDPLKQWDAPMDLPAPSKPGTKNEAQAKSEEGATAAAADQLPRKKFSPTKPQFGKPSGKADETIMKEDEKVKNSAVGDAVRKSSTSSIKKTRPSTAPSETNKEMKGESRSARAPPAATKKPPAAMTSTKLLLKPVIPFYVDLAYVPCHGNPNYVDIDFFRRVRARYYVLSTINPDASVLTSLLEAKETWEDPDLEVTIIPTYDAEVLRYWMAAHRDQLSQLKIDVAPSANRCSIQLQDHETSCAAFRLEF